MAVNVAVDETPHELVVQGDLLSVEMNALMVVDDESFQRAGRVRMRAARWLKDAHAFFDPMSAAIWAAFKLSKDRGTSVIEPREAAYKALGDRMGVYDQDVERQRQAAEAAAQRERERLEAEAAAEAAARQVRLRKEADDARMAEAVAAAEAGDVETAERLIEAPVYVPTVIPAAVFVPPVQVQVAKPKAKGTSFSSKWTAEFLSIPDLVRAAAGGNAIAMACLMGDQTRADGFARSMRTGLNSIPGIRAVDRRTATTRTT